MKKLFFICFTAISVAAIATTSSVQTHLNLSNNSISQTLYDTVPNGSGSKNSMDTSHKWKNNKNYNSKSNKNNRDSTGNNGGSSGNNTDSTKSPF